MESIPSHHTPILVVDDDTGLLLSIRAILESAGLPQPALISNGDRVMDLLKTQSFHLVLLDLILPKINGIDLLRRMKRSHPDVECLIITAVDDVSTAVEAMKYGAFDYLIKPIRREKLIISVQNALQRFDLLHKVSLLEGGPFFEDLAHPEAFRDMIAGSPSMLRVFHEAEIYAANDYNLVLTGETGVGKDMLARIIHGLSRRSGGPFTPVSMPALSQTLFENDLFGHSKGAYTGAFSEKKGFFEEADGGTLFLDEITELDPKLQGAILRVIQERELYRLGSTRAKKVDVRIIAASNRDLAREVAKGRFRSDLYYRLNVCHIHIPPLRERREDILPITRHFLRRHSRNSNKNIHELSHDLANRLESHDFPGNVRELENIVASAVLSETGTLLTLGSTGSHLGDSGPTFRGEIQPFQALHQVEKNHILRVLHAVDGNRTQAARILGIGLRTLQRKLKSYQEPQAAP